MLAEQRAGLGTGEASHAPLAQNRERSSLRRLIRFPVDGIGERAQTSSDLANGTGKFSAVIHCVVIV